VRTCALPISCATAIALETLSTLNTCGKARAAGRAAGCALFRILPFIVKPYQIMQFTIPSLRSAVAALFMFMFLFQGCDEAEDGLDGKDGKDGVDGKDAAALLFITTAEDAGANCSNGGVKVDVGTDDNGDGALAAAEIQKTFY